MDKRVGTDYASILTFANYRLRKDGKSCVAEEGLAMLLHEVLQLKDKAFYQGLLDWRSEELETRERDELIKSLKKKAEINEKKAKANEEKAKANEEKARAEMLRADEATSKLNELMDQIKSGNVMMGERANRGI